MKNIKIYAAEKYQTGEYDKEKENIYMTFDDFMNCDMYVTSLSFEQETEYDEGADSGDISQYPFEDILDKYCVAVQDFYPEQNDGSNNICVLEFSDSYIPNIGNMPDIVGKHVYNKEVERDGQTYTDFVIE